MSLRSKLLRHPKPIHQFNDLESIKWVATNKPDWLLDNYKIRKSAETPILEKHLRLINIEPFFLSDSMFNGIHGGRHAYRVAINATFLMQSQFSLRKEEKEAVIISCLLHDCRRKNDNADIDHGKRASKWLLRQNNILPKHLHAYINPIVLSISSHNDSYGTILKLKDYKKYKAFVDTLKTADGLDRYRFPRSDWWFSDNFVKLKPDKKLKSIAFDLSVLSEAIYLETKDNKKSVMTALDILKNKKGPHLRALR